MRHRYFLASAALIIALPFSAHAADVPPPQVTVTNETQAVATFSPFAGIASGTIGSIASGDLGGDGVMEILVGAGAGMSPTVAVFRQDSSAIGSFLAYGESFKGGVNVAACDVDGDGVSEIVTGAKFGGGPHVRVFDALGNPHSDFFAYDAAFRGGVNIACGDVNGDGVGEIVTGAGPTGGPHIKVFSGDGALLAQGFNGDATQNTGTYVLVDGDVVLSVPMGGADTAVRTFTMNNNALVPATTVTAMTRSTMRTQVALNSGNIATAEITTTTSNDVSAQSIIVDISDQRLTAYVHGVPVNTFLISSGTYAFPTPYAKTPITAKIPMKDYGGVGYWLPNTPWNLRFRTHYYIHTAYWHNNFGHRMSHGCINTRLEDAKWMYDWASIGTMVEIIP